MWKTLVLSVTPRDGGKWIPNGDRAAGWTRLQHRFATQLLWVPAVIVLRCSGNKNDGNTGPTTAIMPFNCAQNSFRQRNLCRNRRHPLHHPRPYAHPRGYPSADSSSCRQVSTADGQYHSQRVYALRAANLFMNRAPSLCRQKCNTIVQLTAEYLVEEKMRNYQFV